MMFKVVNQLIPEYVCELLERRAANSLNMSLRSSSNCKQMVAVPKPNLNKFKDSLSDSGPVIWSSIHNDITDIATLSSFS